MLGKTNITALSEGAIVTEVEDFKWVQIQSGTYGNFVKAIYKNGYLVAITADGTVAYTTDGEVWQTSVPEYTDCKLNDIEWDGSRFILAGSYLEGVGKTAIILVTNDFMSYERKVVPITYDDAEEYLSVFPVNKKYIVIYKCSDKIVEGIWDFGDEWVKRNTLIASYYVSGTASITHSTDGILAYFKRFYGAEGTNYLYRISLDKSFQIEVDNDRNYLPVIKVFECKDNLLYVDMRANENYKLSKILSSGEEMLMSSGINYMFVDGVYFNGCELFINNHEMLVVKKGESIADKTLDDLIEIAPELTMNCITKAFGQLFIFGNQGAILKSSVETNNEEAITVQTISAKKALADAKKYTDEKYVALEARIAALEGASTE